MTKTDPVGSAISLFDATAANFAHICDSLIESGRYRRGELMVLAARRHIPAGATILDHGCGPGRITRLLGKEGFVLRGIDPSSEMIKEARRQKLENMDVRFFVSQNCEDFGPPAAYAAIISSSVIEFVEDHRSLLRGYRSRLSTGGVLLISYANRCSIWRVYCDLIKARSAPHRTFQSHVWSWGECRRALEDSGFEIVNGPCFFESPLDRWPAGSLIARLFLIGTLGLVIARTID
jgi:SAM-dependent methyltransferase